MLMKPCTSLHEFLRFIESLHTAVLAPKYGCVGLKIRLRWLEDMTSLARRFEFVSRMRRIC